MKRCLALVLSALLGLASLPVLAADTVPSDPVALRQQLDTYLFDAARAGDTAMLAEFIANGYDLNRQDAKGYTALILAAYNGRKAAVTQLLQAGADPCVEDKRGNTALLGAIFKGEIVISRQLMAAQCTTNHRNHAGQTPAMYAALFKRAEILEDLRKHGADMDARDAAGNTVETLAKGQFAQPQR